MYLQRVSDHLPHCHSYIGIFLQHSLRAFVSPMTWRKMLNGILGWLQSKLLREPQWGWRCNIAPVAAAAGWMKAARMRTMRSAYSCLQRTVEGSWTLYTFDVCPKNGVCRMVWVDLPAPWEALQAWDVVKMMRCYQGDLMWSSVAGDVTDQL